MDHRPAGDCSEHLRQYADGVDNSSLADFWVPVAAIVPVLALAAVLQARDNVASLKPSPRDLGLSPRVKRRLKRERLTQALVIVVTGAALCWTETVAIGGMRMGRPPGQFESYVAQFTISWTLGWLVLGQMLSFVAQMIHNEDGDNAS